MHLPLTASARAFGRSLRAGLLPVAAFFVGIVPAQSQTAPAQRSEGDGVVKLEAVVTAGTRFNPRTVTESIVPIDVLTNLDLNLGGYTESAQIGRAHV